MIRRLGCVVAAVLLTTVSVAQEKFDGLVPTPPMGWNSWNHFGCDVDETMVRLIRLLEPEG